jgi:hypothetical protein
MRSVYVDQKMRFSLDVDDASGKTFVSFPVSNRMATYEENYEIDRPTFDLYKADPTRAHDFVRKAKARELDHLLLRQPGTDRGWPD